MAVTTSGQADDSVISGLRHLGRPMWNKIPPAPFSKGGEMPASSHSPFNKGGWGDFRIDFLGSPTSALRFISLSLFRPDDWPLGLPAAVLYRNH